MMIVVIGVISLIVLFVVLYGEYQVKKAKKTLPELKDRR